LRLSARIGRDSRSARTSLAFSRSSEDEQWIFRQAVDQYYFAKELLARRNRGVAIARAQYLLHHERYMVQEPATAQSSHTRLSRINDRVASTAVIDVYFPASKDKELYPFSPRNVRLFIAFDSTFSFCRFAHHRRSHRRIGEVIINPHYVAMM